MNGLQRFSFGQRIDDALHEVVDNDNEIVYVGTKTHCFEVQDKTPNTRVLNCNSGQEILED